MNKINVGIFDPSKNMAAVTKNRMGGSEGSFRKYLKIAKDKHTYVGQMISSA